ncbi:MAG: zinc-binding dehydrogenase [Verrucomicrobiales bacterium]|nr:zinc-binding dehydrogenase [Verrucomicrobiales bacterium]
MKTPAAILVEQRQPLVLDEVELPPLGYGQVLVEIHASRICGSQLGEIDGVKGPDRFLPHLLGHEGGGIVREVGPEVRHVRPGDRVVLHWRPGRGIEPRPPIYRWNGRDVNAGFVTTFNRLGVIAENRLTVVPPDTDFEVCCLLADTLTTGFGVIHNDARVRLGEAVVVIGCGGIGLGVVLGAHLAGAHPVIAVDLHDHKLAKAAAFGATHTVNTRQQPLTATVRQILEGAAPDVVVDGTGNPAVLAEAFALVGPQGRCIGVGVMSHERTLSLNTLPLHLGKVLTGSHGGDSRPAEDIPRYVRMMRGGRFDPRGMVSHRVPLEQVNEAIAAMRAGEVVHALIQFPPA